MALNTLASVNPITLQAAALEARLGVLFPASKFDFAYLPASLTVKAWTQALRRFPAVALQFAGLAVDAASGRLATITATWQVYLLTTNASGPKARLLGDALGPGLAGMMALAVAALHGLQVPDAGAATIGGVNTLGAEWLDEAVAAAGVTLNFGPFQIVDADAIGDLAEFLTHGPVWGFPDLDPALSPAPFSVRTA